MITIDIDSQGNASVRGFAATIEKGGFEGVLSRAKAPQYRAVGASGEELFTVKRHMFGNFPFYVVEAPGRPAIKVSEGMSEMRMEYRVEGGGFGYRGDFLGGRIELLRDGAPAAGVTVRSTGEDTSVEVDFGPAGEDPAAVGVALACGSLIGYTLGMRQ